jgi:radical SAM superfamily enzyme YgiQ (UPF0313 family)
VRIVLADLRSNDGFVSKDTVAGGFGSRFRPFSRVTHVVHAIKRHVIAVPSVQLGYVAAICAAAGHEVRWTDGAPVDGDVTLVLTSLVDHRHEAEWAAARRRAGSRVGFIGLAASKLPELFEDFGDFVILGEPEDAVARLAAGEPLKGRVVSRSIADLDALPFPRWDLVGSWKRKRWSLPLAGRPLGGTLPVLSSRGCPEFCTYCPHRILASYRSRSAANIADELEALTRLQRQPHVVFRDPLFTQDRERCLALCAEIRRRGLELRFECETRLDRLDTELLDALHAAGLSAVSFGVETLSPETLKRSGRRPIPEDHQRRTIEDCRRRGIVTAAYYVFGFLQDDWTSIAATIEYSIALRSTVAQFKLLTPYPGTPMYRQLAPRVYETDLQRFDGYTPTFRHPNLSAEELRFLLGAAYTRFYMRPSCLATYLRARPHGGGLLARLDARVARRHAREETVLMARAVTC